MKTEYDLVCDTREQLPLWNNIERVTMHTGDYSIKGHLDKFAIERKSLPDLYQTLTKGHERFSKELMRARELRYFAILVEGSYSDLVNKKWSNSYRTKVPGHVVASIVNTLRIKYNIQIIFAKNRVEAKTILRGLATAYMKLAQ